MYRDDQIRGHCHAANRPKPDREVSIRGAAANAGEAKR
jgi:hypothetical protein